MQVLEHASTEAPAAAAALSNWLESALLEAATSKAAALRSPKGKQAPAMHSPVSEIASATGGGQGAFTTKYASSGALENLADELDVGMLRAELAAAKCEVSAALR